jgi:hypothetical protein
MNQMRVGATTATKSASPQPQIRQLHVSEPCLPVPTNKPCRGSVVGEDLHKPATSVEL